MIPQDDKAAVYVWVAQAISVSRHPYCILQRLDFCFLVAPLLLLYFVFGFWTDTEPAIRGMIFGRNVLSWFLIQTFLIFRQVDFIISLLQIVNCSCCRLGFLVPCCFYSEGLYKWERDMSPNARQQLTRSLLCKSFVYSWLDDLTVVVYCVS